MGYVEWDVSSNDFYLSPNTSELLGIKVPESPTSIEFYAFLQRAVPEMHFESIKDELKQFWSSQRKQESAMELEIPIQSRNGSVRWFEVIVQVRRGGIGFTHLAATYYDITALKVKEEKAISKAARYRNLVKSMPTGVIVTLAEAPDTIVFVNDALANMLEANPTPGSNKGRVNLNGQKVTDFVKKEDRRNLESMLNNKRVQPFLEMDTVLAGVKDKALDVLLRVMQNDWEGRQAHYFFVQDVTELRRVEREVSEKNRELESFTFTVSHDLRTPLITMRSFLGFVEKEVRERCSTETQADLTRVMRASVRLDELLKGLLDYSRVGRHNVDQDKVSLTAEAKRVIKGLEHQIKETGAEVRVLTGIPSVRGVKIRLVQLLQNLIHNAIKFSTGQARPLIEFGCRREKGRPVFFVRDNGIGIDPTDRERIFELFHKLDPDSIGSGIGLSLVRRIVETHQGRIWIENSPLSETNPEGKGTTFCFTLNEPKIPSTPSKNRA